MGYWVEGGARIAIKQLELAVGQGSHEGGYLLALMLLSGLGGTTAHGGASTGEANVVRLFHERSRIFEKNSASKASIRLP